jgi:hypothetical protein
MARFQGGERMHRPAVRECHAWKLLSLACRGRLLVLHEGVCLMTGHTRLAVHEWIRLQLCHLIGVTGFACAQPRLAREVLCGCLAMAHGAFHTGGGMRAGFPLVRYRLMAGGTGISGWNPPMEHMRGLILLSEGRLGGNSQKEKTEQGETEHARAETIHRQTSWVRSPSIGPTMAAGSDNHHVLPECDLRAGRGAFSRGMFKNLA